MPKRTRQLTGWMLAAGLLLLLTANAWAEGAPSYGLDDFFRMGIERAESVRKAQETVAIARYDVKRALSVLAPTLSAYGGYTAYSESKATSSGTVIQPDYSLNYGLRLDQSFNLSARELIAYRVSKKTVEAQTMSLVSENETLMLKVAGAYYDALKAKRAYEIALSNVERLTKHRDEAAVRVRVGEATKNALLRAEAELSSAEVDRIKAENAVLLTKRVLAAAVNIETEFEITEPSEAEAAEALDLPGLKELALASRSDLKALEVRSEIADMQVDYTAGAFWPKVTLAVVMNRAEQDPTSAMFNDESNYATITLSVPIIDWGLRRAELAQSRSSRRQVQLSRDESRKGILLSVERAWRDYLTAQGILKSLSDQVAFAKENYTFVSKQFEHGLATSTDVMDANTLLVTAEQKHADALYGLRLARLSIKRETGTLIALISIPEASSVR